MNDQEIGKRIVEEEHVALFLGAYASAGGERLQNIQSGETPDFVGKDTQGRTVGIELTQLRFGPNERHMRRIFEPAPHDPDAWSRLLELLHKKTQSFCEGALVAM